METAHAQNKWIESLNQFVHTVQAPPRANVGRVERWASLLAGGALAYFGLTRRTPGGVALAIAGGSLIYRGATGHCPLYQALGINRAEHHHGKATSVPAGLGIRVDQTITINRSPEELYRFWRNLENLPCFMKHLESVKTLNDRRSHWVAKAPLGRKVEWDAEIINERENELIAWRSLPGSEVDSAGSVHFQRMPDGRGTEVHLVMKYDPPGGRLGAGIARLLGEAPEQEIQEDLRRLKQVMEEGNASSWEESRDLVQEASEDSFPASDAPAWNTGF